MLEAILHRIKQMEPEEFYIFCTYLFDCGNPCYWSDNAPATDNRPRFIGLLAEIIESLDGESEWQQAKDTTG